MREPKVCLFVLTGFQEKNGNSKVHLQNQMLCKDYRVQSIKTLMPLRWGQQFQL